MKKKSILIVDDEPDMLMMIKSIFERSGYSHITTVSSAEDALDSLSTFPPHLVILDVMMPEMDGFELLQKIRMISTLPVLMLTAKGEAEDRFTGFELGADDYLIKPFLPKELMLRVAALLKRAYPESNRLIHLNSSVIDLDKAEIFRDNHVHFLTAKEYSIILKLFENSNRIVTIGSLCQAACGDIWQGYEATLMTHIRHLREKIEDNPSKPTSLITLKGLGYKLITRKE